MSGDQDPRWISRLRPTPDFGLPSSQALSDKQVVAELPHLRGVPLRDAVPSDATVEGCVPNLAGIIEHIEQSDHVLWDRRLAPRPRSGIIVGYGDAAPTETDTATMKWFSKLVRRLEQVRGVVCVCDFDITRAILLTQGAGDHDSMPDGVAPVPRRLSEFPGGVVLTMLPGHWPNREAYADRVQTWFATTEMA